VLFINSVEYTPDGRSLITTTGEKRFTVVGRSMRDGYNCASIRFVVDETVTDPMEIGKSRDIIASCPELDRFLNKCLLQLQLIIL
jgi:Lon protease-like protein